MHALRRTTLGTAGFISWLLFAACEKASTAEVTPPGIGSLQAANTAVSITKGTSKSVLFVIERAGDFRGTVSMAVENVPTGLLASFSPPTLAGADVQTLLNITVLPTSQPGTYTLRARASGELVESRTLDITITITTPGVTLALSSASAVVSQGQTTSIEVEIVRTGGYTGPIGLTVSGLPGGVTAAFDPAVLVDGETGSTLVISAGLLAQPGPANIIVRAAAQAIEPAVASLGLDVQLAATPALVLEPAGATILQGAAGEVSIPIGRSGGYEGSVALSLEGTLPEGVTATFSPTSTAGQSALLTITSSTTTPVGLTNLVLRASGAGVSDATAAFTLQILERPGILISVSTPQISIAQGAEGTLFVGFRRFGGYSQTVNVTVEGAPSGVILTVPTTFPAQSPVTASATVTVGASVPVGTYPITIRGTGEDGLQTHVVLTLTVTPAG